MARSRLSLPALLVKILSPVWQHGCYCRREDLHLLFKMSDAFSMIHMFGFIIIRMGVFINITQAFYR